MEKKRKIIIIGSRSRDTSEDFKLVYDEFKKWYKDGDIIISGGCPKTKTGGGTGDTLSKITEGFIVKV